MNSNTTTFQTGTYALSETNGPTGYTPSTWSCVLTGTQTVVTVTSGQMALGLGQDVTCTITNDDNAPILRLRKVVQNDNGGNNANTEWTLNADKVGTSATPELSGPTPVNSSATTFAAGTYALSETNGPTGYTASVWSCVLTGTATTVTVTNSQVALGLGQDITCTITNNDNAPALTLKKVVTNDNGGTHHANEWTPSTAGGSGGFSGVGALDATTVGVDDAVNGPPRRDRQYPVHALGVRSRPATPRARPGRAPGPARSRPPTRSRSQRARRPPARSPTTTTQPPRRAPRSRPGSSRTRSRSPGS